MLLRAIIITSSLLFNTVAYAWGPEGHAIVADIAEKYLTPIAQSEVRALLAQEGHSNLDDIASWADQTKNPTSAPWHFVDIPLSESNFDDNRDCPNNTCVVDRISLFANQLADTTVDNTTRLKALKYLVHFVGDIHQPLHTEDKDHDRGGNNVKLKYFGKKSNLHSIWDGAILENALNLHLGRNFSFDHAAVRDAANTLDQQIADSDRANWQQKGILSSIDSVTVQWAEESHSLAAQAYQNLPDDVNGNDWSDDYEKAEWPVVQNQLQKAGIRLSGLLNEIFP